MKKEKTNSKRKRIILGSTVGALSVVAIIASLVGLKNNINEYFQNREVDNLVKDALVKTKRISGNDKKTINLKFPVVNLIEYPEEAIKDLRNTNKDTVGILQFDDRTPDPIVKGKTNEQYLYHDFLGRYNEWGTPFMDFECTCDDTNILLYGHSGFGLQKDRWSFINNYLNRDYALEHSIVTFYIDGEIRQYKLKYAFSNPYSFNHRERNFATEEELSKYFTQVRKMDSLHLEVTNEKMSDKFLTLQTCSNHTDNLLTVVIFEEVMRIKV